MPTFIHDIHQPWLQQELVDMMVTGFITRNELKTLRALTGTSKYYLLY
jgi:hypothetical protein